MPREAEGEWRRSGQTRRRLVIGVATGVYAGVIAAAAIERNHEAGRLIATGAAIPAGATLGAVVGGIITPYSERPGPGRRTVVSGIFLAGGAIVGAVAGGFWAYSASPSARAPVTALGLAPVYFGMVWAIEGAD